MNDNKNYKQSQTKPQEQGTIVFDFKQLCIIVLRKWYWLVSSVLFFLLIAFAYLWFTPTTVAVTGKMEIIDNSKKGNSAMAAGLAMLNNLPLGLGSGLGGTASMGIDAEKEILLSNTLVKNVVNELNLHTEYRLCKWWKNTLLYQNNPVTVTLDPTYLQWMDSELPLTTHLILLTITKSGSEYEVGITLRENEDKEKLPAQSFSQLPATIRTDVGTLTITENKLTAKQAKLFEKDYKLQVVIMPPTLAASAFVGRTTFEASSKKATNFANISLTDQSVIRGIDFINHLVEAYNQRSNDDKNEEARKTDEFVNARLSKIDAELGSSDAAWENSKKQFQITEPEVDAQDAMTKKSEYEAKLVAIGTELQLHDYLSEYVNDPANLYEIIPSGLAGSSASSGKGVTGGSSASGNTSLITQHNALVNERKDLLKSVSEMSPQVQRLNESIKELHPTLKLAMKRDRQQLVMQKNIVEREYSHYLGRIGSAPKMERVLTEIGRQREIKQGVYLLMLQKREETAMELANTTDKVRLVDPPTIVPISAKPHKKMVILLSLFLGIILPVGVLYFLQIIKTKIESRQDLKSFENYPIVEVLSNTNVDADESIRNLRTKLLLSFPENVEGRQHGRAVLVVSQNNGDGRTSLAKKMVESFSAIGKKCEYVNADLRNNTASSVLGANNQHPADILASADFGKQMVDAKTFNDYVIVDTPALGKYYDALQVAQFADITLYIVKAGKTQKSDIESLYTNNLPNPILVLIK